MRDWSLVSWRSLIRASPININKSLTMETRMLVTALATQRTSHPHILSPVFFFFFFKKKGGRGKVFKEAVSLSPLFPRRSNRGSQIISSYWASVKLCPLIQARQTSQCNAVTSVSLTRAKSALVCTLRRYAQLDLGSISAIRWFHCTHTIERYWSELSSILYIYKKLLANVNGWWGFLPLS